MNHLLLDTSRFASLAMLTPDELESLSEAAEQVRFGQDAPVLREGEFSDYIFLNQDGILPVVKQVNALPRTVAELTPGELFGEMSLLFNTASAAEVRAGEVGATLFRVPANAVHPILRSNSSFRKHIELLTRRRQSASTLVINPLFASLPQIVRETLLYNARYLMIEPGEVLFREGSEDAQFMYLVLSGKANVSMQNPYDTSKETVIDSVAACDEVGELSPASGKVYTTTLTAITPLELMTISNDSVKAWAKRYPEFNDAIEMIIERKRQQRQKAMNLMVSKSGIASDLDGTIQIYLDRR